MKSSGRDIIVDNEAVIELLRASMSKGAAFSFRAGGFSMSPFIKDGDLITVSPFGDMPPDKGDIVAFLRTTNNSLTVHRLIKRQGIDIIMKGDNSRSADLPVSESQLFGRVTGIKRGDSGKRLGIGPEKRILAGLSRMGILMPLLRLTRLFLLPIISIKKKSQKAL